MKRNALPSSVFRSIVVLSVILSSVFVYSCGSNQTAEVAPINGTGSVALSVKWIPPPVSSTPAGAREAAIHPLASADICSDIKEITLLLMRKGPPDSIEKSWLHVPCSDNNATLNTIPANINFYVTLTALGTQWEWTGNSETFKLSPNEHRILTLMTVSPTEVASPIFSPLPGKYNSAQSVTLSTTTPGATIRYTTDGSMPSDTVGTVFSGPISVSSSMTIWAVAYLPGGKVSAMSPGAYEITDTVPTYTLTVAAGTGGSVAKNPNQTSYASGTVVTLTATPAAGYTFANWSGGLTGSTNPAMITMNSNMTITANFTPVTPSLYTLTVNSTNGSVTKSPNQTSYAPGTVVTLTAIPAVGYNFANWSGGLTGSTNPATITMNSNKTITANFTPEVGVWDRSIWGSAIWGP